MLIIRLLAIHILMVSAVYCNELPEYFKYDKHLAIELRTIVEDMELGGEFWTEEDGWEQISLAVVDLNGRTPRFAGIHSDNFIYPASVYKMYIAAEVLNQISNGELELTTLHVVSSPNDVDRSKEIMADPRPLLYNGDTVTVNYLLDLMITRSDNSAANCLIDIATRKRINEMMHEHGWLGSEVTRKFLSRKYEDPGYEEVPSTVTNALHAASFLYLIQSNQLINPWVSQQMRTLLGRQLDKSKLARGLPENAMYYHKTGWYADWTHDVGIVDDGEYQYIVACFLPIKEEKAQSLYEELGRKIHKLMIKR